ncbi:MAG: hypothetical protein KDI33_15975 [Halioglobus sp.]|nr:hypothetical protein [Halioglobus sp.]
MLNATDPQLPAFIALDNALQAAVLEQSALNIDFFDETLDAYRFGSSRLEEKLLALLAEKYKNVPVDVVVAYGAAALAFAKQHQEAIWPGAAIVFNSVSNESLTDLGLGSRTAGVPVDLYFEETIELALRLRPETTRIVVVAGDSEADRRSLLKVRSLLESHKKTIDVQYLAGLSLADTEAALRALQDDAIVLYLTMFRDGSGSPLVPGDVLKQLASASPVPVFGVFETYLGQGITAGVITSYSAQGRRAGQIVARILGGEDPAAIGIDVPVSAGCMADWQQLNYWGIPEHLLPPDCDVRFREESAWEQYYWQILAVLTVVLVQSLLIILLVLNRRRLGRAQSALQSEYALRADSEKNAALLQRRLTRFSRQRSLGAMAATIVHEISQPLIAIQNYTQAARRRFQGNGADKPKILELLGKIQGQAERAGAITQRVRALVNSNEVQMTRVSLSTLIDEVIPMLESDCATAGCRIHYQPADNLLPVMVDPLQIQLVLLNLLSNAVHSVSRSGSTERVISIATRMFSSELVEVSVTDDGPGVPPDQVEQIFEPLYSDKAGGMGMGLSICQDIVGLHGGRIWYEANPAGGAIFRFTLGTSDL